MIAVLKVCEYGLALTDGSNATTVVPVADRLPLLQTWVKAKHCLQSHIGKTLGTADEVIQSVFISLTLLVGRQERHTACEKYFTTWFIMTARWQHAVSKDYKLFIIFGCLQASNIVIVTEGMLQWSRRARQLWHCHCCIDAQTSTDGQNGMTRAIVAVELLCSEKIIDFKDSSQPTLAQVSCFTLHSQFLSYLLCLWKLGSPIPTILLETPPPSLSVCPSRSPSPSPCYSVSFTLPPSLSGCKYLWWGVSRMGSPSPFSTILCDLRRES